jgi:hypothetical protein
MAMQTAKIDIKGIGTLLLNNPQTVDRFNKYARRMAAINAKKTRRTDDDYLELRQLEIESKLYFDDAMGVYVPGSWMMEALAVNGFRVAKLSRDTIRGSLFVAEPKLQLTYANMNKVKTPQDIVMNSDFHWIVGLPQGQVRVMKAFPKFQDWLFSATVEFDDKMIDPGSLTAIAKHAAKYNGFGDFRPTFGRAVAEVTHG